MPSGSRPVDAQISQANPTTLSTWVNRTSIRKPDKPSSKKQRQQVARSSSTARHGTVRNRRRLPAQSQPPTNRTPSTQAPTFSRETHIPASQQQHDRVHFLSEDLSLEGDNITIDLSDAAMTTASSQYSIPPSPNENSRSLRNITLSKPNSRKRQRRYSDERPLWEGYERRTKEILPPADTVIYTITASRLIARIMTGSVPETLCLSPWPETNTSGLNAIMAQVWEEATGIAKDRNMAIGEAAAIIPGAAARKLYDQLSVFRSCLVNTVREVVAGSYECLEAEGSATVHQVQALLKDDHFTKGGRVIARCIKRVFFETGQRSLALDKHSADLFMPITPGTIWLICLAIRHSLEEYKTGARVTCKFEANAMTIDTWERLRNTWNSYRPERANRLRALLLQQVNRMRNVTRHQMRPTQEAIDDPYKDTVDDLEDLDPDYEDGFAQLPRGNAGNAQRTLCSEHSEPTYKVFLPQYSDDAIPMPYSYDLSTVRELLASFRRADATEVHEYGVWRYTLAGGHRGVDIVGDDILEEMKARIRNGNGRVTLEFMYQNSDAREEDEEDEEDDQEEDDESVE